MKRCAIYTRKSTEEGLEQDFNSLDAQHEACAAYIKSQKHEGWKALRTRFDDGGFSGGSMDRPALAKLLEAVERREVDVLVVYKVDRLTRSLPDFAKIVELFDASKVSFVSVTQQFNTTTSMGRLTLNVLLSFAQFEREVTAERIRDKVAASKKKGMWMGGPVPLGYQARDRKLVVDGEGAAIIRTIFDLYLELGTVKQIKAEADQRGLVTRTKVSGAGRITGGVPFTRGHLHKILSNPIYVGDMPHKGEVYPGEHEAIIPREQWERVQAQLSEQSVVRKYQTNAESPSLLKGLLFDETGDALRVIQAAKSDKRYRYYVSSRTVDDVANNPGGLRLSAKNTETAVVEALSRFLKDDVELHRLLGASVFDAPVRAATSEMLRQLNNCPFQERFDLVQTLISKIVVGDARLDLTVRLYRLSERMGLKNLGVGEHALTVPIEIRRRGVERKVVIADGASNNTQADPHLCRMIAKAHQWMTELLDGRSSSIREIAAKEGLTNSDISLRLPLAFLAPDIVEAILDGRHPPELTARSLRTLRPIPESWAAQRRFLGFDSIA